MALNSLQRIRQNSSALGNLVERRARHLQLQCDEMGVAASDARLQVMWGGGKDSTLALILAAALSDLTGCSVRATTMVHSGLSKGTLANIEHMVKTLNVPHEWRQFLRIVPSAGVSDEQWRVLYGCLAWATEFHPRFMCVGCNLAAVVTEYKAMTDAAAHFRVTGNPAREMDKFDEWADALRRQFSSYVAFPDVTGQPFLDYYRLWWAVYHELLRELQGAGSDDRGNPGIGELNASEYLYDMPGEKDAAGRAMVLSVLEDDAVSYTPSDYGSVLGAFGWRLPEDIQGGTESDCAMPAAITTLDIQHHGLVQHIEHLNRAAEFLKPLPAMYERAVMWARNGTSLSEGRKLLNRIGVPDELPRIRRKGTPVAMALVGQLLPVR